MDINKLYKNAWEITKKNKPLWVFGIALVFLGSNGMKGNSSGQFDSKSNQGGVDPVSARGEFDALLDRFKGLIDYGIDLVSSISPVTWALLILAIIISITVGAVFVIFTKNWAKGSLIGGINLSAKGESPKLGTASFIGLKRVKDMIWLNLVPWLFYWGISMFLVIFTGLLYLGMGPFAFLFGVPFAIAAVIGAVCISAVQIWAQRVAIIEGKSGKDSIIEGWSILKSNIGETILLTIVNTLLGCFVGCSAILFILLIGLPVGGAFFVSEEVGIVLIILLMLIAIPLFMLLPIAKGILVVFTYSTWNLLYMDIRGMPVNVDAEGTLGSEKPELTESSELSENGGNNE